MKAPSKEQLEKLKLVLELILLFLLVPVVIYTLAKDRRAGLAAALGARS